MIDASYLTIDRAMQADDSACGPACLQAVYRRYGDMIPLEVIAEDIPRTEDGGTLSVSLGIHALQRGYRALMFTFNLQVFDPTWFALRPREIVEKLEVAERQSTSSKKRDAIRNYRFFMELGGRIKMQDLSVSLLRHYLKKELPILTGLNSTYLYQGPREIPHTFENDDLRGEPMGHFVILTGYDTDQKHAWLADPSRDQDVREEKVYPVQMDRLVTSILLGSPAYDGNLLIIQPR